MWFHDLYNYDFRRTEMCIIPYRTQMGEIGCTRVQHGRGVAETSSEKLKANASVAEWYLDARAARRLREEPGFAAS